MSFREQILPGPEIVITMPVGLPTGVGLSTVKVERVTHHKRRWPLRPETRRQILGIFVKRSDSRMEITRGLNKPSTLSVHLEGVDPMAALSSYPRGEEHEHERKAAGR